MELHCLGIAFMLAQLCHVAEFILQSVELTHFLGVVRPNLLDLSLVDSLHLAQLCKHLLSNLRNLLLQLLLSVILKEVSVLFVDYLFEEVGSIVFLQEIPQILGIILQRWQSFYYFCDRHVNQTILRDSQLLELIHLNKEGFLRFVLGLCKLAILVLNLFNSLIH